MASSSPTIPSEFDDHSRPGTPLASQHSTTPITVTRLLNFETPGSLMAEDQRFATSLADTLQLPPSSDGPPQFSPPLPTSPNKSKPLHRFSLSDLLDGTGGLETLGPEIAAADINIASKFCFTVSSAPFLSSIRRWSFYRILFWYSYIRA